jgi:cAMP-dependent protein kinase regulator/CRP/FNR family cyclic AMP-dependent transcriptional regulator/cGMP-dependent protein kinase 2
VVAGEFLSLQGDLAHEFFVIVDGTAQVVRDNQVVATLRPGEFFGEIGLIGKPYRTATVMALSDMKLAVIPRREFRTMIRQFPEVASTILARIQQNRIRPSETSARGVCAACLPGEDVTYPATRRINCNDRSGPGQTRGSSVRRRA